MNLTTRLFSHCLDEVCPSWFNEVAQFRRKSASQRNWLEGLVEGHLIPLI
jgi:hypothetical protein